MPELATQLYEEVLAVGGTISGEHGCGLSRTWYVRRQAGPLYDVFREVKRIFDPQNLFNPGKVVADVPQPLTKNLRVTADSLTAEVPLAETNVDGAERPKDALELNLTWRQLPQIEAESCNGCGRCRTLSPEMRMCPIFRFAPAEESSPRAKANLMRAVLQGSLPASKLASDELKEIADLCVNCHQCRLECPAEVDIPKLMIEAKSQYVAANGLNSTDWLLARLDGLSRWGSRFGAITNWALHTRWTRWVLEKLTGLAQGRKLPRISSTTFLRRADRNRLTRPARRSGGKVLYFVDVYANYYDVQLAEALVAVMQHHGIAVYVPPGQLQSGMARITLGDIERARKVAEKNVALLADAVRQGYQIVCTEPSAALCLTQEYPALLEDEDARLVAANTTEACSYLWKLHQVGRLELDLRPINLTLGYHQPCHLRALDVGSPGESLLRLIPGLNVHRIDRGCSGMAGTFGLRRDNYRASLRAGWGLISALRDPLIDLGTTECSACKIQMEQGTTKPTIHPLKMLALAYGLMPEIEELLTARGEELLVT
jgi:Fe-S oxidoreductase